TQLPNRMLLQDRIEQAIEKARRRNHAVAVMFCDPGRAARSLDPAAQPHAAAGPHRAGHREGAAPQSCGGGDVLRPGWLQGGQ
ncbi:hypothetical protein C7E18_07185, partial [Stenotrophomonas maltophilia]